ncbi:MAG: hypothetical protein V4760_11880 [Bdellovibrionota bacterium]
MLASALLSLSACQTPRHKEFAKVKQGMEKDLVLDAAGNPTVARRWHGKDRWIYRYVQTPDGPQTREVHFQDGVAVYVGTKVVPDVSAEDQDRLNDESNAQSDQRMLADYQKWKDTVGAVTAGSAYDPSSSESSGANGTSGATRAIEIFDANFRESTYGIPNPAKKSTGFEAVQ